VAKHPPPQPMFPASPISIACNVIARTAIGATLEHTRSSGEKTQAVRLFEFRDEGDWRRPGSKHRRLLRQLLLGERHTQARVGKPMLLRNLQTTPWGGLIRLPS